MKHPFKPFFDKNSKILILGSFPSIKSRELGFYYQNKNNRFWKILEAVYHLKKGELKDIKAQKFFLKEHNIALWDVVQSCEIKNSSDSTIKNPQINDLTLILNQAKIQTIALSGKKAFELFQKSSFYQKYISSSNQGILNYAKEWDIRLLSLPSSSSANAKFKDEDLIKEYKKIKH